MKKSNKKSNSVNVYRTKGCRRIEPSPTGFNSRFTPVDDRIPEKWIDFINENRRMYKITVKQLSERTGLPWNFIHPALYKKRYCSYSQYWDIVLAIADILANREDCRR